MNGNTPREHWLEQAELAKQHALQRAPGDISGWVEDMNDAVRFRRLANETAPAE